MADVRLSATVPFDCEGCASGFPLLLFLSFFCLLSTLMRLCVDRVRGTLRHSSKQNTSTRQRNTPSCHRWHPTCRPCWVFCLGVFIMFALGYCGFVDGCVVSYRPFVGHFDGSRAVQRKMPLAGVAPVLLNANCAVKQFEQEGTRLACCGEARHGHENRPRLCDASKQLLLRRWTHHGNIPYVGALSGTLAQGSERRAAQPPERPTTRRAGPTRWFWCLEEVVVEQSLLVVPNP